MSVQALESAVEIERPEEQSEENPNHKDICAVVIFGLIGLAGQAVMIYFFIKDCGDLLNSSSDYPVFSYGRDAKGYIAVGLFSRGIISIGVVGQGVITFSNLGYGLFLFLGDVGGALGLGIYQVGVSWYCIMGQLTISTWYTCIVSRGVNILGPLFNKEKKRYLTDKCCNDEGE